MTISSASETAKAVVRRNTEEVQGGGNFEVFEELFADDFLDHTPQPGRTPDKAGARELYKVLRAAFPDFHADIHWQLADGDRVTTAAGRLGRWPTHHEERPADGHVRYLSGLLFAIGLAFGSLIPESSVPPHPPAY